MANPGRVLIISIKAGAGHLRAASALEAAFAEAHPDTEVRHIESLEFTNAAFRQSFTKTYNTLATELPSVWGYIYSKMEASESDSRVKKLAALWDRANSTKLLKEIASYAPDRIICTHYFPAETIAAQRRKGNLATPLYVTLTDYDIHTMWIQEGVDRYFVATDEMAFALQRKGVFGAEVSVTGIPLMPEFGQTYPGADTMRERLGLRTDVTTVLVSAGGFGLAGIDKVVAELAHGEHDVQLLAIAGRNEKLAEQLGDAAAGSEGRIVPFGFVDNMHELMVASDFAVTKPGGLTSSECLALGLPMLIVQPIPGQEERNADFLLENGVAMRANSLAHLVYKFEKLLAEPSRLQRMKDATITLARPSAAKDVADIVCQGI